MPIAQLRRYGELSLDDSTLPERVALLEEHEAAVRAAITELRAQQARLHEKLARYRAGMTAPEQPAVPSG